MTFPRLRTYLAALSLAALMGAAGVTGYLTSTPPAPAQVQYTADGTSTDVAVYSDVRASLSSRGGLGHSSALDPREPGREAFIAGQTPSHVKGVESQVRAESAARSQAQPTPAPAAKAASTQVEVKSVDSESAAKPSALVPAPSAASAAPSAKAQAAAASADAKASSTTTTSQPPSKAAEAKQMTFEEAFIQRIAPAAQQSQQETGVPASVTLAQAILESDWGRSALATLANNLFGIKSFGAPGSAGEVWMNTWEATAGGNVTISQPFRAYNNAGESIKDHGLYLAQNARYQKAMQHADDPDAFAELIHKAGYATDPAYASKLIRIMKKFNLYAFDVPKVTPPPARTREPL